MAVADGINHSFAETPFSPVMERAMKNKMKAARPAGTAAELDESTKKGSERLRTRSGIVSELAISSTRAPKRALERPRTRSRNVSSGDPGGLF